MPTVLFLFLRRMRAPLIAIVASHAIAIVGLVLIPGVDANGDPWRMGFFHAVYVLAYTATTIGFGEIPHPFTDAQRLWMIFAIYLTVTAWFYALGKIIALLQDPAFQRVIERAGFVRQVRSLKEPFALIVGYGETGRLLVDALDHRGWRSTVVDADPERIAEVELLDLRQTVPALVADARKPRVLEVAGLESKHCAAVVPVTVDEHVNLAVAIAAKLERPKLPVIARSASAAVTSNLRSFGTDLVVDPMEIFGRRLETALKRPSVYLLGEWLSAVPGMPLREPVRPPRGLWVVAGFGRFGKAVVAALESAGSEVVVIEPEPERAGMPGALRGDGTDAETLVKARIRDAVGLVAGAPNDPNNFSIIMTARELNPKLFIVLRQNRDYNSPLVTHLEPDLVFDQSRMVARAALAQITLPLLPRFLAKANVNADDWANELISRVAGVTGEVVPDLWSVSVTPASAPGAWQEAAADRLRLGHLLANPHDRDARIDAVPLLHLRGSTDLLAPPEDMPIEGGDQMLFCGSPAARGAMLLLANNRNVAHYVVTGEEPSAPVWRWLFGDKATNRGAGA